MRSDASHWGTTIDLPVDGTLTSTHICSDPVMRSLFSSRSVWRRATVALLVSAMAASAFAQDGRTIRVGAVSALGVQAGFPESS